MAVSCSACNGASNCDPCQHLIALDGRPLPEVNRPIPHDITINQLPLEVIAECLRHALPSIEDYRNASRRGVVIPKGSSVLVAVCKRWRDTAYATPSLWAVVPVIVAKDRDPRPMAYALELWLARSGVGPLEVVIDVEDSGSRFYWDIYRDDVKRIVGMVNTQAQRLVVLRARAGRSWLRYLDFETLGARNLRRVEILNLEADGSTSQESDMDVERIRIGPAAEPTALVLENWTIPQLGVGTDRLMHVVLAYPSTTDVLGVLERAPRLVSCSIINCSLGPTVPGNSANVVGTVYNSSLQTLEIHATPASGFILDSVRLPRLESLRIHYGRDKRLMEQILAFLHRSSNPPLEVLHIVRVTAQQAGVHNFIAAVVRCVAPTLRDFVFRFRVYGAPMDVMRSHELVDAVFGTGVELPLLSSVTLYGMEYRWSHTLLYLVRELSRITAQMSPKISLHIMSHSRETMTVEGVLASSCFDQSNVYPVKGQFWHTSAYDELPRISSAEILEMIALIDRHSLSFAVYIDSNITHKRAYVDIFPELRTRLLDMCNT